MRVVFMGTPEFAVSSLRALSADHQVVGVYCRPDAASGRGSRLRPPAVKIAAEELGLHVLQPVSLRGPDAAIELAALAPEVVCVAAYGLILPPVFLGVAPGGCLNVHASLLPRWRGAAPIQRAILAGDSSVGVSIMRMESGLDTGPFCRQVSTPVADKNAAELTDELASLGAVALVQALAEIAGGRATWTPQDESAATYAEKVSKPDVAPGPDLSAVENARRVRASLPQTPARAAIAGHTVTLLGVRPCSERLAAGSVAISAAGIVLGCADAAIEVIRLKPQGKGEMDASAWARGARGVAGGAWERLQ